MDDPDPPVGGKERTRYPSADQNRRGGTRKRRTHYPTPRAARASRVPTFSMPSGPPPARPLLRDPPPQSSCAKSWPYRTRLHTRGCRRRPQPAASDFASRSEGQPSHSRWRDTRQTARLFSTLRCEPSHRLPSPQPLPCCLRCGCRRQPQSGARRRSLADRKSVV